MHGTLRVKATEYLIKLRFGLPDKGTQTLDQTMISKRHHVRNDLVNVKFPFQALRHGWSSSNLAARRKRVYEHFEDLEACYFNIKKGNISSKSLFLVSSLTELGSELPASKKL